MRTIIYKPITDIIPYEDNPRINDRAVKAVAESIREFGFNQPITIDKDGVIVTGHTRLKAAIKLGLEEVPVTVLDDLTPEQIRAYRLADNKTAELAEWDEDKLIQELKALGDFDMTIFGFDPPEPDPEDVREDDFEDTGEPDICQSGDLWRLGDHFLLVGDATKKEDVERLSKSVEGGADLYITDPPYNVDYTGKTKDALKIKNDVQSNENFLQFLKSAFFAADQVMKPGAAFYIWHPPGANDTFFRQASEAIGWKTRQILIWVKNVMVLGHADYQWQHEPCLYGWKEGSHYFTRARDQHSIFDSETPIDKMTKAQLAEILRDYLEQYERSVLREDKPTRSALHPTMKPIKLIARLIVNSSRPGETVLDTFGGSGSTLMACEQMGRRCLTMEIDTHYASVIIRRWEEFTGKKAIKEDTTNV